MLKKMRWRFIGSAMAAFTVVVLALLFFVNIWNYGSITEQQDVTLSQLLEVEQKSEESKDDDAKSGDYVPPFDSMDFFSPEVPYMIRFFSVHLNNAGNVKSVNQNYIASVSEKEAGQYAIKVLEKGKTSGYESGYRYLISYETNETVVIFLNSERELHTMKTLLLITLVIAAISLAVVFILVVLLSGQAIMPYLKNMEAQKQFITNASHELKTPLTAISTSADVLAMEYENNEWVESIQSQSAKLSKLITNLVTLSRLNEENPFPMRSEFSLSDVLWEIGEPFVNLAKAKGKHYVQDIADDLTMVGDRTAIQQMISILLDNALKYSPDGANIILEARKSGRKNIITVSNTIHQSIKADTSHLFDRFYRADESHSGQIGGTGIGLSIAKATAETHGGKISVKQDGRIIKFEIVL